MKSGIGARRAPGHLRTAGRAEPRARRHAGVEWACAAALLALGCGKESATKDGAPPPSETALVTSAPAAEPPAPVDSEVTLADAGAVPREALRYEARPAERATIRVAIKNRTTAAGAPTVETPAVGWNFALTHTGKSAAGDLTFELETSDASLDGKAGQSFGDVKDAAAVMGHIQHLKGRLVIDARGIVREVGFTIPDDMPNDLKAAAGSLGEHLKNIIVVFPLAPVGVGARWEHVQPERMFGVALRRTTSYELIARDGRTLSLKTTMSETASEPTFELPGTGRRFELVEYAPRGEGSATWQLGAVAVVKAQSTLRGAMKIRETGREVLAVEVESTIRVGE